MFYSLCWTHAGSCASISSSFVFIRYRNVQLPSDWFKVGKNRTKRREHKNHGVISFKALSKTLSDRWTAADDEVKAFCKKVAAEELKKYRKEQDEYKRKYGTDAFESQKKVYKKRSNSNAGDDESVKKRGSVNDDAESFGAQEKLQRDLILQNQQLLMNIAGTSGHLGTSSTSFPSAGLAPSNTGASIQQFGGAFPTAPAFMQPNNASFGAGFALSNNPGDMFPSVTHFAASTTDRTGNNIPDGATLASAAEATGVPEVANTLPTSGLLSAASGAGSAFPPGVSFGYPFASLAPSGPVQDDNSLRRMIEYYNPLLSISSSYPSATSTSFTPTTRTSAAMSMTELLRGTSSLSELFRGETGGSRESAGLPLPTGRDVANAFDSDESPKNESNEENANSSPTDHLSNE